MVAAARSPCRGRKLSPRCLPEAGAITSFVGTGKQRSQPVTIRSYAMPLSEPNDETRDREQARVDSQASPDAEGPDSLDSRPVPFPGADRDFGLAPKPKVKAQRVDPLLGLDLGGVKIVRLIGEGGMGRVYEAQQARPSRTVAVKVIRQGITSEKTMRRFEREAEFLGKLQHPGIAQIFVVGTYSSDFGDVPFYVMEYLENAKPITNFSHEQDLTLHDKLRLFKQVCEAVSHGHDRGIVHRDLKPGNILVDSNGSPKVIDFGVARSTDSDLALESMKTDTGQLIGTVQYMSPEQFGPDPDDLDGRADVYSLGVVLYELLSGLPPYSVKKKALHEASRVVCEEIPAPLRSIQKSFPRDVSAIAERCLQKDRRHRYHTAGELAADLGRFLDGKPVKAQPKGMLDWLWRRGQLSKPISRRARLVLIFGGILAVGLPRLVGSRLLDFEGYWPETAQLKASAAWTPTNLSVREGNFYRLTATGSCRDNARVTFGPEGTAPEELRSLLGPAPDLAKDAARDAFVGNLPRRMLIARIRDSRILIPVGRELTFVAPWSGPMSFRVNDETESPQAVTGDLHVTLERIMRPALVDIDGKTTISTRVSKTKYLLFETEGIRWQFSSYQSALEEPEYPTLLNSIAWWPLPDKPNTEGWREMTLKSHTPLLKTRVFAWAANSTGVKPEVTMLSANSGAVTSEGPSDAQPGLLFLGSSSHDHIANCFITH
jgi:serine/threonine protein kinase